MSRPTGIESSCHGGNLVGAMDAQVGAFREVLTQQPIGILVGAALPRALRITEVDLDARVDLETIVVLTGLPRTTPCKPLVRISRSTEQRATSRPSRRNCRQILRAP